MLKQQGEFFYLLYFWKQKFGKIESLEQGKNLCLLASTRPRIVFSHKKQKTWTESKGKNLMEIHIMAFIWPNFNVFKQSQG